MNIDVTIDVRSDTPTGRDPDSDSPTLRAYHRQLWSKELPSGARFDLSIGRPGTYLHHRSDLGEYFLASDTLIHTYSTWRQMAEIMTHVTVEDQESSRRMGRTVVGTIVFPGNRIEGKPTINGARGMHPRIRDRFDLTLDFAAARNGRMAAGFQPSTLR